MVAKELSIGAWGALSRIISSVVCEACQASSKGKRGPLARRHRLWKCESSQLGSQRREEAAQARKRVAGPGRSIDVWGVSGTFYYGGSDLGYRMPPWPWGQGNPNGKHQLDLVAESPSLMENTRNRGSFFFLCCKRVQLEVGGAWCFLNALSAARPLIMLSSEGTRPCRLARSRALPLGDDVERVPPDSWPCRSACGQSSALQPRCRAVRLA